MINAIVRHISVFYRDQQIIGLMPEQLLGYLHFHIFFLF